MNGLRNVDPKEVNEAQQMLVTEMIGKESVEKLKQEGYCVRKRLDLMNVIALIGLGNMDWRDALKTLDLEP